MPPYVWGYRTSEDHDGFRMNIADVGPNSGRDEEVHKCSNISSARRLPNVNKQSSSRRWRSRHAHIIGTSFLRCWSGDCVYHHPVVNPTQHAVNDRLKWYMIWKNVLIATYILQKPNNILLFILLYYLYPGLNAFIWNLCIIILYVSAWSSVGAWWSEA